MKILFLHGWTSVPGGVKPTYLKTHGHVVVNPQLPDDDLQEAVRVAQAEFDEYLTRLRDAAYRDHVFAYIEREDTPRSRIEIRLLEH